MRTVRVLCAVLTLLPALAMGQTLDRFLYGGVLLDDKMNFGGGCTTCCTWNELFGWMCGECCVYWHGCNQDHGEIKNLLHLTNPTESDSDFRVEVYYPSGAQSLGFLSGTIAPRGKVVVDMDGLFSVETKAHLIVSSENPMEATLETLTQRPPVTGDPEIAFSAGTEMPLLPFTSTRWRSGVVQYVDSQDWRIVLYVINPTNVTAQGQIRFTRGGQAGLQENVNWERCRTLTLPARAMIQLGLLSRK